jgi:hypothetical protein
MAPVTVREVFHVFGDTDSTSWSAVLANIDSAVDLQNQTWATARITWEYSINWIPNTIWSTTHPLTSTVNPNQTTNNVIRPAVMLAPDSQMQVYVHFGTGSWGNQSVTTGVTQFLFIGTIYPDYTASHEAGHVFGLMHTHQGVGYSAPDSYPGCAGASAEVSQLADSATEERATDSSRYWNGDYCKDTPADPGFTDAGLPTIDTDSCTGLGWGTLSPYNFMSYTCPLCDSVMTPDQARIARCWLAENYPGWIKP